MYSSSMTERGMTPKTVPSSAFTGRENQTVTKLAKPREGESRRKRSASATGAATAAITPRRGFFFAFTVSMGAPP